jgi:two-component system response regulator MtrA
MISEALSLALADEDFAVTAAATGEDGLELLESAAVDVVLLDLMLPGIDGLTVCRTVRERGDLPIIVIAGLEAGAGDYVTKP